MECYPQGIVTSGFGGIKTYFHTIQTLILSLSLVSLGEYERYVTT